MSTYEEAQKLLRSLEDHITVNIPRLRWAQLGQPILTCEGVALGVTGVSDVPLFEDANAQKCEMLEVMDVTAMIARDCAIEFNDDGSTDPVAARANSERMDADLAALRSWTRTLQRPSGSGNIVALTNEGGFMFVQVTTSVIAGW